MKKKQLQIVPCTAIIIAKNEAKMIANCIETVRWCQHILVVNNGSQDETAAIATKLGASVLDFDSDNFAELRNAALKHVSTEWLFYIDADERVTPRLFQEIAVHIETNTAQALSMHRENVCYGHTLNYGGWAEDRVTRVFKHKALQEWTGSIHESPQFEGELKLLHTPLLHLTHRSTQQNLLKSAEWTIKEAELLAEKRTAPVTFSTLLRKGIMEFVRRGLFQRGYKDGMAGMVEALVQGINRVLVYIQVWELQQTPSVAEKYQLVEQEVVEQWKQTPL